VAGGRVQPWTPVEAVGAASGYRAYDPLSARQFILRKDAAGWQLAHALLTHDRPGRIETDNEAKAWAAQVLEAKAGLTRFHWEPGPAALGWSSLRTRC
jgi:hypothetical protein